MIEGWQPLSDSRYDAEINDASAKDDPSIFSPHTLMDHGNGMRLHWSVTSWFYDVFMTTLSDV